jgi:hypothetical protein
MTPEKKINKTKMKKLTYILIFLTAFRQAWAFFIPTPCVSGTPAFAFQNTPAAKGNTLSIGSMAPNITLLDSCFYKPLMDAKTPMPNKLYNMNVPTQIIAFWDGDSSKNGNLLPDLQQLAKQHANSGLEVLAIYTGQSKAAWLSQIMGRGNLLRHYYEGPAPTGLAALAFGAVSTPTYFLLNTNKKIIGIGQNLNALNNVIKTELLTTTATN